MKESDLKHFRKKLLSRQKTLTKLIEEGNNEEKPVNIDESQVGLLSRLEAMEEKAVAEEISHKRENELTRIEIALKRMEKGEYGFCSTCGEDIDKKRLELDPSALFCIDCAKN